MAGGTGRSETCPTPSGTPASEPPLHLARLLECVKNNLAIDLKACKARVFLVGADERVKNILATTELILIEELLKE